MRRSSSLRKRPRARRVQRSSRSSVAARAVDAAVRRAALTRLLYAPLQRLPRSVQADGRVVRRDARLRSDLGEAPSFEVDLLEDARVLGLERRRERAHTAADTVLLVGGDLVDRLRHLGRDALGRASGRVTAAVVVDDRVPEDAVEPGRRALVAAQLALVLEAPQERALHDLL